METRETSQSSIPTYYYDHRQKNHSSSANIRAITNSGAQSDFWSLEHFLACEFTKEDLTPVKMSFTTVNSSPLPVNVAFFAKIQATSQKGHTTSCRSMVYVSSAVSDI